jgi:hypothetical protein
MSNETRNKIIACVGGSDWIKEYSEYDLTFDSSEAQILEKVAPAIQEEFNVNIREGSDGDYLYKVRKAVDSQNIYIIPNSTAG